MKFINIKRGHTEAMYIHEIDFDVSESFQLQWAHGHSLCYIRDGNKVRIDQSRLGIIYVLLLRTCYYFLYQVVRARWPNIPNIFVCTHSIYGINLFVLLCINPCNRAATK